MIDHKKVSSYHCSLRFDKPADGSDRWNLTVGNPSKNRVFVDDSTEPVGPDLNFGHLTKPVSLSFIFPRNGHPIEELIISPPIETNIESSMSQSPTSREEKRLRRELRVLEKKNSEWEVSYNDETTKLMETENMLVQEIAQLERTIEMKKTSVVKLKNDITRIETEMTDKDKYLLDSLESLREGHLERQEELTRKLNSVMDRLVDLTSQKSKHFQ